MRQPMPCLPESVTTASTAAFHLVLVVGHCECSAPSNNRSIGCACTQQYCQLPPAQPVPPEPADGPAITRGPSSQSGQQGQNGKCTPHRQPCGRPVAMVQQHAQLVMNCSSMHRQCPEGALVVVINGGAVATCTARHNVNNAFVHHSTP